MIIKYEVEVGFIDKYTKEKIERGSIIDVTLKRMKELNQKRKGRVVDIIEEETEEKQEEDKEESTENVEENKNTSIYTEEDLKSKTVNELKELAEEIRCDLTKATKKEIIEEILSFQEDANKKEKGE